MSYDKVERRKVSRWFILGKSFATKSGAHRHQARQEMYLELFPDEWPDVSKEELEAAVLERFPPSDAKPEPFSDYLDKQTKALMEAK